MKPRIWIADLPSWTQPKKSVLRYPKYAKDWGIEQDFHRYLLRDYSHIVSDVTTADFVYLPIYWTRIHLSNDYGRRGLSELAQIISPFLNMGVKKLTICQYDDGPLVELGDSVIYLGSRKTEFGRDAPLLATPLPQPIIKPERKILASFAGRYSTHETREKLFEALQSEASAHMVTRKLRPRSFSRLLLKSMIVLCPRGYGGSSFRFYEALQMGAVPWLIGDIDSRPFKKHLPWNDISFYSSSVDDFIDQFQQIESNQIFEMLDFISRNDLRLRFGDWNSLVIDELRDEIK